MLFVLVTLISIGYFSLLLVPEIWPTVDTFVYMAYELSLFFMLVILAFLGAWGAFGIARARIRLTSGSPSPTFSRYFVYRIICVFCFRLYSAVRRLWPSCWFMPFGIRREGLARSSVIRICRRRYYASS